MDKLLDVVVLFVIVTAAVFSTQKIITDALISECDKRGSFYVGNKVYECKLKESK